MIRLYTHNKIIANILRRLYFYKSQTDSTGPTCLVLHPVTFPNKGPLIEQYLAEQAIGLVSSLNWQVVIGPFWAQQKKRDLSEAPELQELGRFANNHIYMQPEFGTEIKDGTYVKTSIGRGMIYKGGIVMDQQSTQTDGDLHKQWQNKQLRQSLANASLVKCRKVTQKYYFTKGKLQKIIEHVLKKQPSCIFINTQLKPGQIRNLKKLLESQVNNRKPPKGFTSGNYGDQDLSETQLQTTNEQQENNEEFRRKRQGFKKIQIFDRFSIILQIFARRTTSKLAKLQIELSYLSYLKTRLVRDGSTYSSNLNFFSGDLLKSHQISLQIISAKQRRAIGTMTGQGQSQLQIQRRNIKNKESKIRKQIEIEQKLRKNKKIKDKQKNVNLPIIALVGYTNVGKSAFMNHIMGKTQVQSKDLLFQTLKTTARYIKLPSGNQAMLLDTIGFITDLPIQMIDSFKATLEDISHADIVIHLRDLSHPQNQLQKESVLTILKQLNFQPDFYKNKMIQVWNKVDLVKDQNLTKDESDKEIYKVSCTTGKNMSKLLQFIDKKLNKATGKIMRKVTYGYDKHFKVIEWLKKVAHISCALNQQHNYEPSPQYPKGSVTIQVQLDDVVFNKLIKFVHDVSNKQYVRDKSKKGLPPKQGW